MNFNFAFKPCCDWLLRSVPVLSPYGKKALRSILHGSWPEIATLKQEFDQLEQVIGALQKAPDLFPAFAEVLVELRDISGTFANLQQGQTLDEVELFEIKTLTLNLIKIRQRYLHCPLRLESIVFFDLQPLLKLLNPDEVVTASFYVYESYLPDLRQLRKQRQELENRILSCDDPAQQKLLRQQRSDLLVREKQLEFEVRARLSIELKDWLEPLQQTVEQVARLELLLARAVLARRWPSTRPELEHNRKTPALIIDSAVNPEIAEILEAEGKSFCPVSIELQQGVTILTGANMGGKTVALLTVAFNAQLARLGFYAFAQRCRMPMLDFISFVGGDGQNQKAGLSSFGAEIINLSQTAAMIKQGPGLALFDEFARSTNPNEGARFVQALCEFLQEFGCFGLVATHYDGIKIPAAVCYQVMGLKETDVSEKNTEKIDPGAVLDRLCANMDYRLQKIDGQYQVPHDALRIARLLAVDPDFLAILKKFYD